MKKQKLTVIYRLVNNTERTNKWIKLLLDGLPSLFLGGSDKFIPPDKGVRAIDLSMRLIPLPIKPLTTEIQRTAWDNLQLSILLPYKQCSVLGDQVLWGLVTPTDPIFPLTRSVLWRFPVTTLRLAHQSTNFFVQRRDNSLKLRKSWYWFHIFLVKGEITPGYFPLQNRFSWKCYKGFKFQILNRGLK